MKIGFSGHETFVCRSFWLKKGYDLMQLPREISVNEAVVRLGVGRNMVTAIHFWLRGFDVYDRELRDTTRLGNFLFDGVDPFLEDTASLWLLQYAIISKEKVFIFHSFFNEFTKEKTEFTKEHLISFLKRKTEAEDIKLFSDKTYESDATVFLRTYVRSNDGKADLEDETANLLIDLNLITVYYKENTEGRNVQWYRVARQEQPDLPNEILLFSILDRFGETQRTISFNDLLEAPGSPGSVFRLSERALEHRLKDLAVDYAGLLTFSETAGNRILQITEDMNRWTILEDYYGA